jgi:hypothetical protein
VKRCAGGGTQPGDITRVRGNLGFDQHHVNARRVRAGPKAPGVGGWVHGGLGALCPSQALGLKLSRRGLSP